MLRFWFQGMRYAMGVGGVLAIALLLGGCDSLADLLRIGGDNAEAQQERRIETFSINAGTFLILTDTEPTVQVQEGTTTYTGVDGSVTFTPLGDSSQSFELDPDDTVIERPGANIVTLIRLLP